MHSLGICSFVNPGPSFNDPYNSYTEAAIRVKGSLELISMQILQTMLKYKMQKRLNSSVNHKSSLLPYLKVETLLLSLLLLRVTNTLDFS